MPGSVDRKVALVTGGGSGIGRASALAFAREGARVVVADVSVRGGYETVDQIEAAGGDATFVRADVSKANEAESLVRAVVDTYGRLDCAHNNAGIEGTPFVSTADYAEEDWDRVISVNLKGVWLCMKYEIRWMLKQRGGAIVNTSSIHGLVAGSSAPYAASKHGVVGLTKTAALEYIQSGIRINAVCPGLVRTPMVERYTSGDPQLEMRILAGEPSGRMGTAEEIAAAVVWLCSDAASFISGHAMAVDGGYTAR